MKRVCAKCSKLHDHDYNCTVGKFDKYYRNDQAYKLRNTRKWQRTRDETLDRDHHLCVACRFLDSYLNAYKLEVHHVIDISICIDLKRLDLVYDVSNCLTLCQHHHRLVHKSDLPTAPLVKAAGIIEPEDTPLPYKVLFS